MKKLYRFYTLCLLLLLCVSLFCVQAFAVEDKQISDFLICGSGNMFSVPTSTMLLK